MKWLGTLWAMKSYNAAYLSALCLVGIQVGIGCIMRASQTSGKYTFSTSSSVTISEFFKFLISSSLIIRSCMKQRADPAHTHEPIPTSPISDHESGSGSKERDEDVESERLMHGHEVGRERQTLFGAYLASLKKVSVENRFGFAKLALLYALINNTIFVAYKLADPGTIALVRSGVIFITALIMVFALGSDISKVQWTAIMIQLCGLVTTQYTPDTGTSYPLSTYMVLLFQVMVSSIAGVYNQSLLKSDQASLNAQNAVLYGCGIAINSVVHLTLSWYTDDEPGFFIGYNNSAAYLVIVSNVFIGLAITAVYKYANAVIKCLATAVATGILLYISPILFGTTMAPLILPGGLIVFITSWLYMESPAPKKSPLELSEERPRSRPFNSILSKPSWRVPILALSSISTVFIIAFCETMQLPDRTALIPEPEPEPEILYSSFNTTMAFIRWNNHHEERVPLIEKYKPFFHTLHLSMPSFIESPMRTEFQNLTHDNWGDGLFPYVQMARTMQLVLEMPRNESVPEITGVLQFHFDAWISPMEFAEEDYTKMWMAISRHGNGGGPTYVCMTKRDRFGGWLGMRTNRNWHYPLLHALDALEKADTDFVFNPREWCTGWSDIYYIPRHLWVDYIYLATFFGAYGVFHEIAIPTIIHIIDQSRRQREISSIITWLGDCYGGCCAPGATLDDLLDHRCGHKIDYLGDKRVINTHYENLDYAASLLNTTIERPEWNFLPHEQRNWTTFTESLSEEAMAAFEIAFKNVPLNHTMEGNTPPNFAFNSSGLEPPLTKAELKKLEQDRLQKLKDDKAAKEAMKVQEEKKAKEAMAKLEEVNKIAMEKFEEMKKAEKEKMEKEMKAGQKQVTKAQENET